MSDSITCPKCGMTSYNANDIREGYCGNCKGWTSPMADARGATHRTECVCWSCKSPNDAASGVGHDCAPDDGDITLCIGCGEWGIFDKDAEGNIRQPTDDEYAFIVDQPMLHKMRAAWLHVTEKKQ